MSSISESFIVVGNGNLGNSILKKCPSNSNIKMVSKSTGFDLRNFSRIIDELNTKTNKTIFYCVGSRGKICEDLIVTIPIKIFVNMREDDHLILFTSNDCANDFNPEDTSLFNKRPSNDLTELQLRLEKFSKTVRNISIIRTNFLYGKHKKKDNIFYKMLSKSYLPRMCLITPTSTDDLAKDIWGNLSHIKNRKINHYSAGGYVDMRDLYAILNKSAPYIVDDDTWPYPYFKHIGHTFGNPNLWSIEFFRGNYMGKDFCF